MTICSLAAPCPSGIHPEAIRKPSADLLAVQRAPKTDIKVMVPKLCTKIYSPISGIFFLKPSAAAGLKHLTSPGPVIGAGDNTGGR